jgi:hypothetical protein
VIITLGLPLVFAKPKVGVPMYLGGWTSENRPQGLREDDPLPAG